MRQWLINFRTAKKMSQKQVADICSITHAYYCMIEQGKRNPSVRVAKKIAETLDLDWLIFFTN